MYEEWKEHLKRHCPATWTQIFACHFKVYLGLGFEYLNRLHGPNSKRDVSHWRWAQELFVSTLLLSEKNFSGE